MSPNRTTQKDSSTTGWEIFSRLVRIAMGAGINLTPSSDPYAAQRQGDGWR